MTVTRVHLTRIRPGRLAEVNQRLEGYQADPAHLGQLGIRRLQFFTTDELAGCEDGVVVAVIEGEDEDSVIRFLDANEAAHTSDIDRLYLPHGHDAVRRAVPRFHLTLS
ncbi:MAG TPA: hypothetical protein VF163_16405 [Micromonosporaceae bacterium]